MALTDLLASRNDARSIFFRTLCAPFKPPNKHIVTRELEPHIDPPELPVDWAPPEPDTLAPTTPRRPMSFPQEVSRDALAKTIYNPPKKWEWTAGLPFTDTEPRMPLSSGGMCSAFVKTGLIGDQPLKYVSKIWLTNTKWRGFFSELALYKVQLKSLQGRVVPTIINVYASVGAIDVAMEPPHPSFWIEASPDMPNVLKKRCIRAYEKLHAAGVLHGDVELRHMLIGGDARVTIIDFQESRALIPNPAVQLAEASPLHMQGEMRKVKYRLDFEGARDLEDQRVMRAKRLAHRNATTKRTEAPSQDDILNPPVGFNEWQSEWHAERPNPQRFVMPGQSTEELEQAVKDFLDLLDKLEKEDKREDGRPLVPTRKSSPEFKLPAPPVKRPETTDAPASPKPPKRKAAERDPDDNHKRPRRAPSSGPAVPRLPHVLPRQPPTQVRPSSGPTVLRSSPALPQPAIQVDFARDPSNVQAIISPECPATLPPLPSPLAKRKRDPDTVEEDDPRPRKRPPVPSETLPTTSRTASSKPFDYSFRLPVPTIFKWIENIWRVVS